ncbi:MAG TPA: Wzz/FepE/Etk N-terminal domain-containing protein, partial [Parasegetibacter sp.]
MEFVYIFRILSRRKWSILAIAVIAVIAAFLFTLKKKPVYKSVAQMSTGYTLSEDMKLADEGFNVPHIDVKFNNAIENITSAKVLSLLSYRLLLHDLNAATPFRSPDHSKASQKFQSLDKKEVSTILQGKIDSITTLSSRIPVETEIIEYLKFYEYDVTSLLEQLYV